VPPDGLFIGLMSGTSMDGIDAVLIEISGGHVALKHQHSRPYSTELRQSLAELACGARDDLHTFAAMDRRVGLEFAIAAEELLSQSGTASGDVRAIGSHGQTVRHHPHPSEERRYSVQIGDPASIAERTGISTVADFRRRDIAAGGEGAPLVPLFHAAQFARAGECRAIVNIGGIANATLLQGDEVVAGFDCGPGNTLLDNWVLRHRGEIYDAGGAWSAEHAVIAPLLEQLLGDGFFALEGPRSTGPERFNLDWVDARLSGGEHPGDVQATLAELTARGISASLTALDTPVDAVFVCGGGARNTDLMRRLHQQLVSFGIRLGTTDELGLAPEWVEAAAFAWLASRTLAGLPGNAPLVTGARGPRILGAIHPG
jgi:anhydro-N-acetylmuramic acid kinase